MRFLRAFIIIFILTILSSVYAVYGVEKNICENQFNCINDIESVKVSVCIRPIKNSPYCYVHEFLDKNDIECIINMLNSLDLTDDNEIIKGADISIINIFVRFENGLEEKVGFVEGRYYDNDGKQYAVDSEHYQRFIDTVYELKSDEIIFLDVPLNHYAHTEINEFSKLGIVNGYGNGYFGAEDSITYEHFGLLLDRLFDYNSDNTEASPAVREDIIVSVVKALGIDVSASDENVISESFTDCDNIRDENKKYIAGAIENGIVVGSDGKLFPDKELTRAETVVLLQRAVNYNR